MPRINSKGGIYRYLSENRDHFLERGVDGVADPVGDYPDPGPTPEKKIGSGIFLESDPDQVFL